MKKRTILLALTVAATTLLPGLAMAQKKVPGEKWKTTVSMESSGMSMPARTSEMCAPIGKAEESMARPDNNSNCTVYDTQRAGNKFSAKMRCTGETPMEGSMEMVTEGNTMRGTTKMKMSGMDMTMKYESTRLGSCEAVDYSDYKPPVVAMPQAVDSCKMMSDEIASGKSGLAGVINAFVGTGAPCAKHAAMKNYCSAVQTPRGFGSLSQGEREMAKVQLEDRSSPMAIPLTSSLRACGLGTDKASVDAMRKRLLVVAETNGEWNFLVNEGDASTHAMLNATAMRECSGRAYTNASSGRYAGLCSLYASGSIPGDRATAMQGAGGNEDRGSGSAATGTPGTPAEATPPASTTDKAKETLDKGKKALRGLFGG